MPSSSAEKKMAVINVYDYLLKEQNRFESQIPSFCFYTLLDHLITNYRANYVSCNLLSLSYRWKNYLASLVNQTARNQITEVFRTGEREL